MHCDHAQIFMSIQFHTTHDVRSYEDWFERDSQDLRYDFHAIVLQHLQAKRPGTRWVLKAPGHLFGSDALLRRYPECEDRSDPPRSAARDGVDGESCHRAAARIQRSTRIRGKSPPTGRTAGRAPSKSFSRCAIARQPSQFLD